MATTRMPSGDYKKMLIRIPADVLAFLEERAARELRSVNAEWVYLLRQVMQQEEENTKQARANTIRADVLLHA